MDTLIGKEIGGCRIESLIGRGGMGAVYKAFHLALQVPVAIKILNPVSAGGNEVERFLREARMAAKLKHPNIVGVLNVGNEKGCYYIVMEYIDGKNVLELIKSRGKFDALRAVRIACRVLDALELAFQNGIVHRDIKPENILIDKNDESRLADLGLARMHGEPSLTQTHVALGSPHYIAPEQARDPRSADHRADIYSLGCTLYHMLSGKPPFDGMSAIQVILGHVKKPVPVLRDVYPGVLPELSDCIKRMMQKKAADRYQTPMDARSALENIPWNLEQRPLLRSSGLNRTTVLRIMIPVLVATLISGILFVHLHSGKTGSDAVSSVVETSSTKNCSSRSAEAVLTAVLEENTGKLRQLLDRGVSPNQETGGSTPLHEAVRLQNNEATRLLLERGADPDRSDSSGHRSLHYALRNRDYTITSMLLERGADPNAPDRDGHTPLWYARTYCNRTYVRLLKERGADLAR
jgi:serine/threonine protein kinase